MTRIQIIKMQERIGTKADGFWGPKSIAACQRHLKAMTPSHANWPETSQAALNGFYGPAGTESRLVNLDVAGMGVRYEGRPVKTIRCHQRVAISLGRVILSLSASHPEILALYAGCYNNRPMRGGSLPSLHARGAAIDLAPDTNRNSQSWPASADMPMEVMEAFAREGWLAAGAFWHRDAMHFQATT